MTLRWCRAGVALVAIGLLASCASPSRGMRTPEAFELDIDPGKFTKIALRDDVEIEPGVIHAATASKSRSRWLVVQYVEQENRKGFAPDRESEYANLFLVRELAGVPYEGEAAHERYLVVDLWHYYPDKRIKTCHQWTIWEEQRSKPARASFRLLVEDFNNTFLEERQASLDAATVELLGEFYVKIKAAFARRIKDLRIA